MGEYRITIAFHGTLEHLSKKMYNFSLQDEWRSYASCVGLVDTGYFKRSNLGAAEENLSQMTSGLDQNTGMSSGVREEMNLLMDILQGAIFDETSVVLLVRLFVCLFVCLFFFIYFFSTNPLKLKSSSP